MSDYTVAALYQFTNLAHYRELRDPLLSLCERLGIKGTLLLASEGINGTASGGHSAVDELIEFLNAVPGLHNIPVKHSYSQTIPFLRMKVKLKREIVTLGVDGICPAEKTGTYVSPQDWNALISDPSVTLIDTRNSYETQIGTFVGAADPGTAHFRQFPAYVLSNLDPDIHTRIAMFCTGGIRCEKSTAYLLAQGFKEVYHLEGGILKYLEVIPQERSLWRGGCFVFDERVTVTHNLEAGSYELCHGCRMPIHLSDKQRPEYRAGVCCHMCIHEKSAQQMRRYAQRQKQIQLARERGTVHLGYTVQFMRQPRSV